MTLQRLLICVAALSVGIPLTGGCRVTSPQRTLREGASWYPPTFPLLRGTYHRQKQIIEHEVPAGEVYPMQETLEPIPAEYDQPAETLPPTAPQSITPPADAEPMETFMPPPPKRDLRVRRGLFDR